MKIIHAPNIFKLLTLGNRDNKFSAMYFLFFILIQDKKDLTNNTLINHEKIHHEQAKELLFVFFYPLYLINYIFNLFRYNFNSYQAYKNILFEKEAYKNENNLNYLKTRKKYHWLK